MVFWPHELWSIPFAQAAASTGAVLVEIFGELKWSETLPLEITSLVQKDWWCLTCRFQKWLID
jgi:hypothetical protein